MNADCPTAETAQPTARRSQKERSDGTISKIVDATIASLLEVGYARTSVKEVCTRAGVSHGGVFRHFETMLDVFMAAADEVAQRQVTLAQAALQGSAHDPEPLVAALHHIRDACRSPINAVFYELIVAARTDAALHQAMTTFSARYVAAIEAAAAQVSALAHISPEMRMLLVTSALHLFDGEALTRTVQCFPERETQRMAMLIQLARLLVPTPL
ncbi:MAG: TetR/AcrR family transcriptional regulator [Aquabacterium sp.]|nr:TetR/AcrR family transcriptional regulator [Aquabacterium sp.]